MINELRNFFLGLFNSDKLPELFGIDIRALALFRIGIAFVLLHDLTIRIQDVRAHYSDFGVLPREILIGKLSNIWHVSFHLINGTPEFQYLLFSISFLLALCLLLGFQTRVVAILSWLLLISVHARNPLVLQGGDTVLRLLLFWCMFLPIGACWSIDSWINGNKNRTPNPYLSASTFALLLQICFIYWFSALLKTDDVWRKDGTAAWYALSIEQFSTPLGLALLQYPGLLKVMTFSTLVLEGFIPFLAFCPIFTSQIRMIVVVLFMAFHLVGLNLTLELGHFSYICAVAWIVFIPTKYWDRCFNPITTSETMLKISHVINALAIVFITCAFLWNVGTLRKKIPIFSHQVYTISSLFRLDQFWNMFAPFPIKQDGWYIIPAKLQDGTEVNLIDEGGPLSWEKPERISSMYKNDRWKAFMLNLLFDPNSETYLKFYAWYLCRHWNENHTYEKQLKSFEIVFMLKLIDLNNTQPIRKMLLWHHECLEPNEMQNSKNL